ncbi:MAG: hypothetical protein HY899_01430 [Deltaproteobacteria bacterium]|nr:hypothetical protein [Deltaproteobacteria bacterium]
MGDLAAATIVAKNRIALARVVADSFARHHPEIPFFVLLADEPNGYFNPDAERFTVLRLEELAIPDLAALRSRYTQQELTYAMTPYVLTHLLDRGFDRVAFFKQESLVVGDLTPVLELLGKHSIVLTPHLLEPPAGAEPIARELNILQSGVFNVGFLGVSDTFTARGFLSWWESRMREHCRHNVPAGIHFEQRWLDLVPAFFDDVVSVRDVGFNVGHWNMPDRSVTIRGDDVTVNGQPCRFVRFSGFDPDRPYAVTRYSSRLDMSSVADAAELFRRYSQLLAAAGYQETKTWPYAYRRRINDLRALARRVHPASRVRAVAAKLVRGIRD